MGYHTNGLSFRTLRNANVQRLPTFRNKHGTLAHASPDGSDWGPAQWLQALIGEIGEYANFRKKFERGDLTLEEFQAHAAKELADAQIYLDLLALRCLDRPGEPHPTGISLGEATRNKFNEVSDRVDSPIYIGEDDDWHVRKPMSISSLKLPDLWDVAPGPGPGPGKRARLRHLKPGWQITLSIDNGNRANCRVERDLSEVAEDGRYIVDRQFVGAGEAALWAEQYAHERGLFDGAVGRPTHQGE